MGQAPVGFMCSWVDKVTWAGPLMLVSAAIPDARHIQHRGLSPLRRPHRAGGQLAEADSGPCRKRT